MCGGRGGDGSGGDGTGGRRPRGTGVAAGGGGWRWTGGWGGGGTRGVVGGAGGCLDYLLHGNLWSANPAARFGPALTYRQHAPKNPDDAAPCPLCSHPPRLWGSHPGRMPARTHAKASFTSAGTIEASAPSYIHAPHRARATRRLLQNHGRDQHGRPSKVCIRRLPTGMYGYFPTAQTYGLRRKLRTAGYPTDSHHSPRP